MKTFHVVLDGDYILSIHTSFIEACAYIARVYPAAQFDGRRYLTLAHYLEIAQK